MSLVTMLRQGVAWGVARMDIRSERGASAVEYGLMIALIAAVIILAVYFLGKQTSTAFSCTTEGIATKSDKCP